jgi:hypothetical protein
MQLDSREKRTRKRTRKKNNEKIYIFLIDRQSETIIMDKLSSNQKKILLLVVIIILGILIYKIYSHSKKSENTKEGFTSTSGIATDLLTKLKSYDAQATNAKNPADLELSIYPWTTKLYNLQSQNQVKAIGLYKPHLSINGTQYAKLGDMLSQHADYTPPDNTETTLLIGKVGSDIKPPTDYTPIVSTDNANVPNYYYQLNNLITPNLAISSIASNIQHCRNSMNNLNTLLQNNNQAILNRLKSIVNNNTYLQIGNTNPITLTRLNGLPRGANRIITASITHNTNITIPAGVDITILANDNGVQKEMAQISFGAGIDFSQNQTTNTVMQVLSSNTLLQELTGQNIILNTYSINAFTYVNSQDIINYLNDLCNNISTILNLPGLSEDFANYLNLADSLDGLSTVMAALSTLTPSTSNNNSENNVNIIAGNNILMSYASVNNRTLLGGILNLIINYSRTINYPSLRFTPDNLVRTNLANDADTTKFNNLIANSSNILEVKTVNSNILDTMSINLSSAEQQLTQNIISSNIPNISNLLQFNNAIANNQLEYFPLQIYAPVAPAGYQSLGHVFCNVTKDLTKIKTMNNIACIPSGCVKEVREWTTADKVFEYNRNGIYWALYKNPYIGTFIAVSKPGLPDGKVCKVVACVAKCSAVDELKKAEQCARTYQALNKTISSGTASLPDLVASTEEDIYLQQIKTQNDNIITLQNRARQLQTDIDKSDVITTEMNKAKLQNYVDTQKRNIELVADRLEKDQNKIQANINIPLQVLNQIITMINNLPNLNTSQKTDLTDKIVSNAQAANSGLLTSSQYNANLNNILRSCPEYDLTGLVKKSVVGDVCYGCGTPS